MNRERVVVADLNGCALCGIPEPSHGVRPGLGHISDDRKGFVAPSEVLLARREKVRFVDGRRIGAFDPTTGMPTTHLVECVCPCGATALATPERAATARCGR